MSRRRVLRLLLVGLACMVGGETFCFFGPLNHPRLVHVVCHAILYTGILLCFCAALLHWGERPSKEN